MSDNDFFVCIPIQVVKIASKILHPDELGRLFLKSCGLPAELSETGKAFYSSITEFQESQRKKKEKQLSGLKNQNRAKAPAKEITTEEDDSFRYKKSLNING